MRVQKLGAAAEEFYSPDILQFPSSLNVTSAGKTVTVENTCFTVSGLVTWDSPEYPWAVPACIVTAVFVVPVSEFNAGTTNLITVGTRAAEANPGSAIVGFCTTDNLTPTVITGGTSRGVAVDSFVAAVCPVACVVAAQYSQTGDAATEGSAYVYVQYTAL